MRNMFNIICSSAVLPKTIIQIGMRCCPGHCSLYSAPVNNNDAYRFMQFIFAKQSNTHKIRICLILLNLLFTYYTLQCRRT